MCKHGKKVRSNQASISINSCTELTQFSLWLSLSSNKLMKPQKWRLSWWRFLFITASNFWRGLEPSHRTNLGWIFVKCSDSLKLCCNYSFYVSLLSISKKEMTVTFTRDLCYSKKETFEINFQDEGYLCDNFLIFILTI